MSWANVPDGRPEKYVPRQISKGDDERWQSAKLREERLTPLDQLFHREAEP
jgi:hypothetical protein